jgi:hypothetical protein
MKKLITFVVLTGFVLSCSKSDDDILNLTFLEKYEGAVWLKDSDDEKKLYRKFNNNLNNPYDDYQNYFIVGGVLDCFYKDVYNTGNKEFTISTITKNHENTLELELLDKTGLGMTKKRILRYTVSKNSLKLEMFWVDDDNGKLLTSWLFPPRYYRKSSINLDELPKC